MFKKDNLLLLFLLLFVACNNNQNNPTSTTSNTANAVEKNLLNVIKEYPDSLLLREQLIQYYRDSADYDKALAITSDVLKRDSLNDRFWNIKATLYFENYDTTNAIKALNTAININPSPQYIITLGSIYAQKRDSMALKVADLILRNKMTENGIEAFFIKGMYYNFTGNKNLAISFFDKCLNLDYNYMFAYREKAIALYNLGNYLEAIAVLRKAVTLQNNFDEGYYWLGRCLEKLNKPNDAIEEYKNALLYNKDYVEARDAINRLGRH